MRSKLRTGDVLLFRGSVAFSRLIESVERGEYSHSAFVTRWKRRAMVMQAEWPRLEAVPTSVGVKKYSGRVDWYRVKDEHRPKLDLGKLEHEATRLLGSPFAALDLLRVGLYNFFHKPIPRPAQPDDAYFCSEYVAHCFRHAGLDLAPERGFDLAVSPDAIRAGNRLQFMGTIHWDGDARREALVRGFDEDEPERAG